jgi:hypothetical protein
MSVLGNLGDIESEAGVVTLRAIELLERKIERLENTISSLQKDNVVVASHADLEDLDNANAGHSGFASSAQLTAHLNDSGDPHSQYAEDTTTISAGTGLTGGGSLAANRTIDFDTAYGDARYGLDGTESYSGLVDVQSTSWTSGITARFDGTTWVPNDPGLDYAASGRYVYAAGDTMTGELILPVDGLTVGPVGGKRFWSLEDQHNFSGIVVINSDASIAGHWGVYSCCPSFLQHVRYETISGHNAFSGTIYCDALYGLTSLSGATIQAHQFQYQGQDTDARYALSGAPTLEEVVAAGDATPDEIKLHGGIEFDGVITAIHADNNIAYDLTVENSMTPDTSEVMRVRNAADSRTLLSLNTKGEIGVGYANSVAGFAGYVMGFIATDDEVARTGGVFAQVSHQDGDKNLSFFQGGISNAMTTVSGGMAGNYTLLGHLGAATCAVDTPDESHANLAGFVANIQRNSTSARIAPAELDETGYYSYGGVLGNWKHMCGFWHNQNTPGYYAPAAPTNTPAIYSCFHGQVNAATAGQSYGLHIKHVADDGYFDPITPSDAVGAYLEFPLWGTRKSHLFLEPSGNIFTATSDNWDGDVAMHDGNSSREKGLYEFIGAWKKLVSIAHAMTSGQVVSWNGTEFVPRSL